MLRIALITIAVVSTMCLLAQRSFAQGQESFCSYDPEAVLAQCGGGIACHGTVTVLKYEEFESGYYWYQAKQACTGGYGCYVMTYDGDFDLKCYSNELRLKETQVQLAKLASDQSVIIADCRGHYRQYRGRASAAMDVQKQ